MCVKVVVFLVTIITLSFTCKLSKVTPTLTNIISNTFRQNSHVQRLFTRRLIISYIYIFYIYIYIYIYITYLLFPLSYMRNINRYTSYSPFVTIPCSL